MRGIFNQATRRRADRTPASETADHTAIHTVLTISNAFSIAVEVSSWKSPGRLEFGPYAGTDRGSGYRLVYRSGEPLLLTRVTVRGSSVVDASAALITFEDKKAHRIVWQRHADGTMKISIDGKAVLDGFDRAFTAPFAGFIMINRAGDYTVRKVEIDGTD